ncbi:MAG TPA: type II toxin-antitoxin system Phd/YefM family antitoxin [Novimethylophilus sp.]|jgi:prevent-host-death family protein|uniref:type II toxin-antitoxin system Phd/YefM family antitoxin n=1 Tax=Novimethylophilus sp. TaxID=2137426 RepID=UPI002F40AE0B
MNPSWQLQEAKNRFSEVVDEALIHGPQTVTRHGREVVVILSIEEYRRMQKPKNSLLEALQVPAEYAVELDITRSRELPRDIDL